MLVPLQQAVGTGYNAGLTATTFAVAQPDQMAGGGYTSPSGIPIGGLKLGKDVSYRQVALAQAQRYTQGPPAAAAASESGYIPKDRRAYYLTEGEQRARHSLGGDEAAFAWWAPFFDDEQVAMESCLEPQTSVRCDLAQGQWELQRPLSATDLERLPAEDKAEALQIMGASAPKAPSKMPWVLLGVAALLMAWPAFRPQYRRGIAANPRT